MVNTGLAGSRPLILAVVAGLIVVSVIVRIIRGRVTGRKGIIGLVVAAAVVAFILIREFVIK